MFRAILISILGLLSLAAHGADTQASDKYTMNAIELNTSRGPLAANLYLPKGVKKPPVLIVTGAWTTVKEQMPAVYAKALAEKGYAAVTFDFRGWGQSKDSIKYLEDPKRKTEDILAVIDAVSRLKQVDGKRIAGVGICASAGYMLDAAVGNRQLKSVAVVAPWLHDKKMATAIYGEDESVKALLAKARKAEKSQTPIYIEAASNTNKNALMYQAPYYTEKDRGLIPEYDNKFNLASWIGWLNYNALKSASKQDKPVLMVASESMALPAGAHQYLSKAGKNVSAIWLDGITQFDFYDQPKAVNSAVTAIDKHFKATLK